MIKIENYKVAGVEHAVRGMRNPMNSWEKSDSCFSVSKEGSCQNCEGYDSTNNRCYLAPHIGKNDYELMMSLAKSGSVHGKYRRMIIVYLDITAPLYWWKEFDTYKVGTVANSCSTMHKVHAKRFRLDDFSHEHLVYKESRDALSDTIAVLNHFREAYVACKQDDETKKNYWWQIIQLLPSSYNQKRTIMLNYEVLANVYQHRCNHKLNEWQEFCKWIEGLPYSSVITCGTGRVD